MLIRGASTIYGALLFAASAGIIALIGLASVETDEPYCDWGYVISSETTCEVSAGLWVARLGGGAFALTAASILWSLYKAYKNRNNPYYF
jgi:hypothetical protein